MDKRMKSQMFSKSTDITNKNQQIEGNRQSEFKELHIRHSESVHQTVWDCLKNENGWTHQPQCDDQVDKIVNNSKSQQTRTECEIFRKFFWEWKTVVKEKSTIE